ncbi:WavE lipopolysaccharide synthesis family protein [Iodobacter fluviatilis]|uniref:WavE lipopolysaccharide synthesis n=1 Tax=Iodobacter fluviatilis TaxID=537 RepID=A0A377STY0_9NEIS|nr:WavE lipopolysaccharide synthesis family protein [Iodobacter fluviatilis]TCU87980.1 WavE lipopolysaccharide synthesis protein [Iodobacter fluviatilis]STR45481.1 WavE lipopolysaccharide synthesis [Iodobacter fluviatilis]
MIKYIVNFFLNLVVFDFPGFERFLNLIFNSLNIKSKFSYYTFHARPKRVDQVSFDSYCKFEHEKVGIVIQGPIKQEDDFTYETAISYRKNMPSVEIVISTWHGQVIEREVDLMSQNIYVIKSTPPNNSGLCNINYQIVSTKAGIDLLRKLNCKYILKTRSDQRLYAPNIVGYLLGLLNEYPSLNYSQQKARIVELSLSVCRYRPYSMCDMFQFGHVDDLSIMWSCDLDARGMDVATYSKKEITPRILYEDMVAEIYLHRSYLRKIGVDDFAELSHYYKILSENFIIIDKESVDLFWNKYHSKEYHLAENPVYDINRVKAKFYYRDWILVKNFGPAALDCNDTYLDRVES